MLHHFQILRFSLERLIRIVLRPEPRHPTSSRHCRARVHRRHLLSDLRGVVAAKEEVVDGLQAEQREEVPGQAADPADVKVARAHAGLEHRFKLRCQGKGEFYCGLKGALFIVLLSFLVLGGGACGVPGHTQHEASEKGVDPPHDQRLRHHHRHVPFHRAHHALHGRGIRHGIRLGLTAGVRVGEESAVFVCSGEISSACGEGGGREDGAVGSEVDAAEEGALLAKLGEGERFWGGLEEDAEVVSEDSCEYLWECGGQNGFESQ